MRLRNSIGLPSKYIGYAIEYLSVDARQQSLELLFYCGPIAPRVIKNHELQQTSSTTCGDFYQLQVLSVDACDHDHK